MARGDTVLDVYRKRFAKRLIKRPTIARRRVLLARRIERAQTTFLRRSQTNEALLFIVPVGSNIHLKNTLENARKKLNKKRLTHDELNKVNRQLTKALQIQTAKQLITKREKAINKLKKGKVAESVVKDLLQDYSKEGMSLPEFQKAVRGITKSEREMADIIAKQLTKEGFKERYAIYDEREIPYVRAHLNDRIEHAEETLGYEVNRERVLAAVFGKLEIAQFFPIE